MFAYVQSLLVVPAAYFANRAVSALRLDSLVLNASHSRKRDRHSQEAVSYLQYRPRHASQDSLAQDDPAARVY